MVLILFPQVLCHQSETQSVEEKLAHLARRLRLRLWLLVYKMRLWMMKGVVLRWSTLFGHVYLPSPGTFETEQRKLKWYLIRLE